MILEWVKALGPILISWPVVGLIAILVFRKPLLKLVERFTNEDIQRVKFGSIELERMKAAIGQATSQIEKLYMLSLSDDAFYQLKRLNSSSYGPYWLDPDSTVGLALSYDALRDFRCWNCSFSSMVATGNKPP